jgi:outer membrane protein W
MLRSSHLGGRVCISFLLGLLVVGVLDSPGVFAQSRLNFYAGEFFPRSESSRDRNDVLVSNLDFLVFDIKDFKAPTFGAEYLAGIGNFFEAGIGVGYQSKAVPSVYADFVNSNGNEIEQELKLRVIPATATIRWVPLGVNNVTPYIGAGVGIFTWRYTESGEFLATDATIFRDTFVGSGSQVGLVVLGGVRVPLGNWGIGGEVRYQKAEADLPADQEFAGTKIDLGGVTGLFTVNVRF